MSNYSSIHPFIMGFNGGYHGNSRPWIIELAEISRSLSVGFLVDRIHMPTYDYILGT